MIFSEIEDAVLSGNFDAGVIIHESRFTYAEKGLVKLVDLGAWWEQNKHSMIPLGGIAIKESSAKNFAERSMTSLRKAYPMHGNIILLCPDLLQLMRRR